MTDSVPFLPTPSKLALKHRAAALNTRPPLSSSSRDSVSDRPLDLEVVRKYNEELEKDLKRTLDELGISMEDLIQYFVVEMKPPKIEPSFGVEFPLDFNSYTFRMTQEYRIRRKTPEELVTGSCEKHGL